MRPLGSTQRWVLQWISVEPSRASAHSRREVLESLHKRGYTTIDQMQYVRYWGRNRPIYHITPAGEQALKEDALIAEYNQRVNDHQEKGQG
jgi:DNA-binding PadR family transcriptional regulator